jgi:head-tail adaptor
MSVRAAKLDRRLGIWERVDTRDDDTGQIVYSWRKLGDVYAEEIISSNARARYFAHQQVGQTETIWRVRARPTMLTLTPDRHMITHGALKFMPLEAREVEREEVAILCIARNEGLTAQGRPPQA